MHVLHLTFLIILEHLVSIKYLYFYETDFNVFFQVIAKTYKVIVHVKRGKIVAFVPILMLIGWLKIARNPAIYVVEVDPHPQVLLVSYIFENKKISCFYMTAYFIK